MAVTLALGFCGQCDRDIALFGRAAQIIVAHKTIEVKRRGPACDRINRQGFGQGLRNGGGLGQGAAGGLQTGAFGHVEHQLQLGLIVKRQELDRHRLGRKQGAGQQGCHAHRDQARGYDRSS